MKALSVPVRSQCIELHYSNTYLRLKIIKIDNLSFVKIKDQERLNKKAVVTDCTCIGNMTQTWEKTKYTQSNQGSKITPYHPPFVLALNLSYMKCGEVLDLSE